MARRRPTPLFSASAPQVHEDVPDESRHPASFTSRLRRFLQTDGEALFAAERLQSEYQRRAVEAEAAARTEQ